MNSYLVIGGKLNQRFEKIISLIYEKQASCKLSSSLAKTSKTEFNNNPDILFIKAQPSIGIKQIRQIQKFLSFKAYQFKYKSVILKEAEKLTIPAQNAFLKTLEEPSANSLIYLSCQTKDLLLTTITSRCQIIRLSNTDNIIIGQKVLTDYYSLLTDILEARVGERLKLIEPFVKSREQAIEFLEIMIKVFREKMILNQLHPTIVNHYPTIMASFQQTLNLINANVNVKLAMDNLVINLNYN